MRYAVLVFAASLILAACATDGVSEDPSPGDSGAGDGPVDATAPSDGGAPAADGDADAEAERPLVCGETGFCETRLPMSNAGEPLSLRSVWVVASNDVWSVSADGLILHYDGTSWSTVHRANHALNAIWATPTDAWAVGELGLILHFHAGGAWTHVESGHMETYRAIAGTNSGDVWFGRDDAADRFDGTTLTSYSFGIPGFLLTSMVARAGFGAYAVGYVKGPPQLYPYQPVGHRPYIFQLEPTAVSIFNPALTEVRSFVPLAAVLTDAPEEEHRLFIAGYMDQVQSLSYFYAALGKDTPLVYKPILGVTVSDPDGVVAPPPPLFPTWGLHWNDLRIVLGVGSRFHFDGAEFSVQSVDMGDSFVPRTVFDIHGNATDSWMVGDGFALKGPAL